MVNKYPRTGVETILVGDGEGTHTTPYPIEGFITNISIRARHKTTHAVVAANGGATINLTIH